MNTVLWIAQGILSIKFLATIVSHGFRRGQPLMRQGIQRMGPSTPPLLSVVSVLLALGSAGLLLPAVWQLPAWVVPFSAAGLGLLMLLSIPLHMRCREKPLLFASVILAAICAFVAYGRWLLVPLP